jgi:hypothetical protein
MLRAVGRLRRYGMKRFDRPRTACVVIGLWCVAIGCAREPQAYRGAGLHVDSLPPVDVARVYRAALGAAFTLRDPALSLLLDPLLLPRGEGLVGGDPMPSAVHSILARDLLVKGTCQVPPERTPAPLVCRAARPGYVVRLSAPFALGAGHDSVQVHLVVQQYAIPNGPVAERLRFERAYRVVRDGPRWRAVSEARLPPP